MNEEEAIRTCKKIIRQNNEIVKQTRKNKDINAMQLTANCDKESIAIETVLNLLEKKDKQIEQYQNMLATNDMLHVLECEKKDKIIDEMSKFIEKRIDECPYDFWIEIEKELNCKECEEDYSKCWKQYFERKVEDGN